MDSSCGHIESYSPDDEAEANRSRLFPGRTTGARVAPQRGPILTWCN
ncbi:MAG: hypothetical protein JRI54_15060 [Deltaproteobacteria bacterium]|nr:hypothetical protein [Deltaproteobacteria bacterium]